MQNFKLILNKSFTKVDKDIITNTGLSLGAKLLYCFLCGLPQGKHTSNSYLSKSLNTSERSISYWRSELVKADVLHIERISKTKYQSYLGNSKVSGIDLMNRYKIDELHSKTEQPN